MPTVKERNAAFDAVKAKIVASGYGSWVKDSTILELTDAALKAAEAVRGPE